MPVLKNYKLLQMVDFLIVGHIYTCIFKKFCDGGKKALLTEYNKHVHIFHVRRTENICLVLTSVSTPQDVNKEANLCHRLESTKTKGSRSLLKERFIVNAT